MTQPYLYMRNRSSSHGQCAVFKEINRQIVQIGNDFGTTETALATNVWQLCTNRVIHWGNDILAINYDTIYKYDTLTAGSGGTGDWEIYHNHPTPHVSALTMNTLLQPVSINGSGLLMAGFSQAGSTARSYVYYFDINGNIVQEAQVDGYETGHTMNKTDGRAWSNVIFFSGKLFYGVSYLATNYWHDVATDVVDWTRTNSIATISEPSCSQAVALNDRRVHLEQNGNTYYVAGDQTANNLSMYVWEDYITPSNSRQVKPDSEVGGSGRDHKTSYAGSYALTKIGDKLYLFGPNSADTSYQLHEVELDENFDVVSTTDLTSLLPASITAINPAVQTCCIWRLDVTTNGPDNPIVELEFSSTDDGVRYLWTWEDAPTGNTWTNHGTVMSHRQYAWVDAPNPGPYVLSSTNVSPPTLSLSEDKIHIDAEIEIFGPTALANQINLELYYSTGGGLPNTRATIVSTTKGIIINNRVINLSPGDILTVSWAAVRDGIQSSDKPKVNARVFV